MKNGNRITSSAYDLRIIPLEDVAVCTQIGTRIFVKYESEPVKIGIVPGTFFPNCALEEEEGSEIYTISHSFKVSKHDAEILKLLHLYKDGWLIALYIDQNGRETVSGSTSYPLKLSLYPEGEYYACTLKGKNVVPDSHR